MPSPTDGSHQLPIPTDELVVGEVLPPRMPCGPAVAIQGPRHLCVQRSGCGPPGADPANLPPGMPGDISGPSAPVSSGSGALAPWDKGENISGPLAPVSSPSRPLRGCVSGPSAPSLPAGRGAGPLGGALSPCLLALRHGGKRVRALDTCAIHPSLNFREDDRLLVRLSVHALVGVRGEGDGGLGVLCCVGFHGHPRAREGEMPETSGASQVHLWLRMEVLLRQLRNLERSRPPAAPHCDSICVQ